ncbi:hypothetical protein BT69DRAFT_1278626 [Atractiella rhizophila]|nr:hypothetical protein BT69DRAFT_1278626 [Atractiella rhizophila]
MVQSLILICCSSFPNEEKGSMWEQMRTSISKFWTETTDRDLISLEDYARKLPTLRNVSVFRYSAAPCFTTEHVLLPFCGLSLDSFSIDDNTFLPFFPGCIPLFNSLTLKNFSIKMRGPFDFQTWNVKERLQLSPLQTLSFNYNYKRCRQHFSHDFKNLLTCTPSIQKLCTLPTLDDVPVILGLKELSLWSFSCPEAVLNELISSFKVLEYLTLSRVQWTASLFSHLPHSLRSLSLSIPSTSYVTPIEIQDAMLERAAGTWAHVPLLAHFTCEAYPRVMPLDLWQDLVSFGGLLWDDGSCANLETKLKDSRKECSFKFRCET